jgi:hypothetical protein
VADNKYTKLLHECEKLKQELEHSKLLIDKYVAQLFEDTEQESIESKINKLSSDIGIIVENIEEKKDELIAFHQDILVGTAAKPALKTKIENDYAEIESVLENANEILDSSKEQVAHLDEFYDKIFGHLNADDERVGGLEQEIEERLKQLDIYEKTQKEKLDLILSDRLDKLKQYEQEQQSNNKNLYEQVESLLPGATNAGLAKAYQELKDKFTSPIRDWNIVFIVSLSIMFLATFLTFISINHTQANGLTISFSQIQNIEQTINSLLFKLPLYAPLVWLAIYASKRRSENQRLQQEYAHKEALARSYDSYKTQIEKLNQSDQELLKKLLDRAIDTIAHNASETLDGKHGDGTPAQEVLKQSLKQFEDIKELISKLKP